MAFTLILCNEITFFCAFWSEGQVQFACSNEGK